MAHWSRSRRERKAGTHIGIYEDEGQMKRDIRVAARNGWEVAAASNSNGHINVRRTALQVVLLSPLSLIFGASRTKDKVTVTYRYRG